MKNKIIPLLLAACFASPIALSCKKEALPPSLEIESSTTEEVLPETPPVADADPPTSETPPVSEAPPAVEPTPPEPLKAEYVKTTANVNVRAGAGTSFSVLGSAEKGSTYAITGKVGNWYKTYYRGKTAYISTGYVSVFQLEKTESKVEEVIEEGYKLLGVPYVYGAVRFHDGNGKLLAGFTAQKFDCSSLVQYVFYKGAGKLLGVNTRVQVLQGKAVKRSELARGDCIFFTNEARQYKTGIERVGHVGIYLGDGYLLHTSSDYARIEKMSTQRWNFYIEARRFI